jgi:hypothetical protein
VVGVTCGTDMFDPFPAAPGVMTPLSFTINPPSTNSRIVCRRKDRGGRGCSRRWLLCFRFYLFWWQTPCHRVFVIFTISMMYYDGVVVLW